MVIGLALQHDRRRFLQAGAMVLIFPHGLDPRVPESSDCGRGDGVHLQRIKI
ncbi:hypothetical protein J6590_074174 [Homalodisca vitripennis]|nr:hypothetical protein J6590_074174 [Homalodisca vitripennis]